MLLIWGQKVFLNVFIFVCERLQCSRPMCVLNLFLNVLPILCLNVFQSLDLTNIRSKTLSDNFRTPPFFLHKTERIWSDLNRFKWTLLERFFSGLFWNTFFELMCSESTPTVFCSWYLLNRNTFENRLGTHISALTKVSLFLV